MSPISERAMVGITFILDIGFNQLSKTLLMQSTLKYTKSRLAQTPPPWKLRWTVVFLLFAMAKDLTLVFELPYDFDLAELGKPDTAMCMIQPLFSKKPFVLSREDRHRLGAAYDGFVLPFTANINISLAPSLPNTPGSSFEARMKYSH